MIARLHKAFRLQLLPLALGFIALGAIVGARSWLIMDQQEASQATREAFELERSVLSTLSLLQDAETSQRGFLLTGEEPYLEPYNSARAAMPKALDGIRDRVADNAARVQQAVLLKDATAEKFAELDDTLAQYRSGDVTGAMAIVKSDRGKVAMDRIRTIVADMRRDISAGLQLRLDASARIDGWLNYASLAALLAVAALGLYGVSDARRRMRTVTEAHDSLTASNAALKAEIAGRETAEAQIRQMQKMEAVGQLTGGIAHDFNNMLAVIMSAMNLAQRKLARGDVDIGKFIDSAIDATSRAASLTARLLAFSRQQPLSPQVLDANRMVGGMSDLLRRTLGETIEIETVLAGGLWRTSADPSQLENAVINLAVNARDAMPEGGKLTIETANCHLDDSYAARHAEVPAGQYVLIAVTDTGTGMGADVIGRAFDPFFTTKATGKGTGLGLSQVFGFVKQTGGHVKIYSEPGQGTTVKVYLPRFFGEGGEEVAAAPTGRKEATGEVILVVEDDERVRVGTVETLRELGYTVVHSADAADALRKLEATPEIALLFTDIVMPVTNGRKLAEAALEKRPGLKVLFTTGFTRNAVVHNGVLDHGVNFIAKPFTIDQIAAKLREVLDC